MSQVYNKGSLVYGLMQCHDLPLERNSPSGRSPKSQFWFLCQVLRPTSESTLCLQKYGCYTCQRWCVNFKVVVRSMSVNLMALPSFREPQLSPQLRLSQITPAFLLLSAVLLRLQGNPSVVVHALIKMLSHHNCMWSAGSNESEA